MGEGLSTTDNVGYRGAEDGHEFGALVQRFRSVEEHPRALVNDYKGKVIDGPFLGAVQFPKMIANCPVNCGGVGLVAAPSSGEASQNCVFEVKSLFVSQ